MAFKKWLFIAIVFVPVLAHAAILNSIQVRGIQGELKFNTERRLKGFFANTALLQQSEDSVKQQVEKALAPFGYFNPQVQLVPSGKTLIVTINPGPPTFINTLTIRVLGEGEIDPKIQTLLQQFPLHPHQIFNSTAYEEAKLALLNIAEQQGYLKAKFDKASLIIHKAQNVADIEWVFNTGYRYFYGQLRFEPTNISEDLLYRYAHFKYGQHYKINQLLTFNSHLAGSGYFDNVTVTPNLDDGRFIPITVKTHPVHPTNYTIGLGYGTDTGVRGRLGWQRVPVNRHGDKFNLLAQGSFVENALTAQYTIPGFNPVTDLYALSAQVSTLNYNSGYANSALFSFAKQHNQPTLQRSLGINALYERFNYTLSPKQDITTLFPKFTLTNKVISSQLFSKNGYSLAFNGLGAKDGLLSQLSFTQFSIEGKGALTSDPLGLRLYLHGIAGITNTQNVYQVPLSLALLLGGADNLRAYSFNSIGPGKHLTFGSIELQKETVKNWFVTGFFDKGYVTHPVNLPSKQDVGIGLMWVSPVGPIKIALAQAIDNQGHRVDDKYPRLVINMGPDL